MGDLEYTMIIIFLVMAALPHIFLSLWEAFVPQVYKIILDKPKITCYNTYTNNGDNMVFFYTIFPHTAKYQCKSFSIAFSENNIPKDKWDHHDAVKDYLIDTNPNPFEPIPDFTIIRVINEAGFETL